MSKDIHIPKGLSIKLKGSAEKRISDLPISEVYTLTPSDLHGLIPKLHVKEGDRILAGEVLFSSKVQPQVQIVAPVSGILHEIERGEKRKILAIKIKADNQISYKDFGVKEVNKMSADDIKQHLSDTGCWPYFNQRPYAVTADPNDTPRDIFISTFSTAPLAPNEAYALSGQEQYFQIGINLLNKLTTGKVHLGVNGAEVSFFDKVENVEIYKISGKHPAGNVGFQINHIKPINKGDKVWTLHPQDVALIGKVFATGKYDATRVFALAGSDVVTPQYYRGIQGASLSKVIESYVSNAATRIILGDVLTGKKSNNNAHLGFYTCLVTAIPEGDYYTFFGWMPFTQNQKLSLSRTFFSFLTPNREYVLDTNLNGEERALVITGEMEKVFPMDIYPMQLLKAALAGNIEQMENLGIYEVAPEDFGLIDFSNTSKFEAQEIIREALDIMIQEVG